MSDIYSIQTTTLTALGDAVRTKTIGQAETPYAHDNKNLDYTGVSAIQFEAFVKKVKVIGSVSHFPGAAGYASMDELAVVSGYYDTADKAKAAGNYSLVSEENLQNYNFEIQLEGNIFTFFPLDGTNTTSHIVLNYEAWGLDANGNEFKYTPLEMVNAITNLPPTIPEASFFITGDCTYKFAGGWDWFIELYGDRLTTSNLTNTEYMFKSSSLKEIPFDINISTESGGFYYVNSYLFYGCRQLETLPRVTGRLRNLYCLAQNCERVRQIPESWATDIDWDYINNNTDWSEVRLQSIFQGCYSLRTIPEALVKRLYSKSSSSNGSLSNGFSSCYTLNEIVGVRGLNSTQTSNIWSQTFNNCFRLKRLVFDMDNGTPRVQEWKSQIIDLSYVGWTNLDSYITGYNSGIVRSKRVKDDTTYQALKDDPDWYAVDIAYSRYNHDSAVETINSLPDTSTYLATAGGTNTIKFKGDSGSATDGGAINTMTEEEIAVATAKGWTVTFV